MSNGSASQSHSWADGDAPHEIKQEGKTLLHRCCRICGRDFVHGLDGAGWSAAYVGVFKVELLTDSVSARWLKEPCPKKYLASDNDDRAMRRT